MGFADSSTAWISANVYAQDGSYTGTTTTQVDGEAVPGEWLQLQAPEATVIKRYRLNPSGFEIAFQLVGSQDGSTWTRLHRQEYDDFPPCADTWYELSTETAFVFVRLITEEGVNSQCVCYDSRARDKRRLYCTIFYDC